MRELSNQEIKEIEIGILRYIDVICKENGLTYYLAFGSLLGAVRHKGFIPWDDDIDIMMPRIDYEKLKHVFPLKSKYKFMTPQTERNYPYAYGKVVDTTTSKIEPLRKKYQVIGVDVDVFPIDVYPNNIEEAKRWCANIKKMQDIMQSLCCPYIVGKNPFLFLGRSVFTFIKHSLDDLGLMSVKKYSLKIDRTSQMYNGTNTDYVGVASVAAYGANKRNKKKVFCDNIILEFEGERFPAPIGYADFLTDVYGDYMKLPPLDKRETHHSYKAYAK